MDDSDILQAVCCTIRRHRMLADGDRVLVAVSGGPDSVALLHLLVRLRRRMRRLSLCAAHLNHMLRGTAAEGDERYVRRIARRLRVQFVSERCDVRAASAARGVGIEEAGRAERYEFFARTAKAFRAGRIALGHHADDNAETVLHHIIRGTGIRGLRGIPPCRPLEPDSNILVVRPLIEIPRARIEAYLRSKRLRPRQDASNRSLDYFRNVIRHRILPVIEESCDSGVRDSLNRLAAAAYEITAHLEAEAEAALRTGPLTFAGDEARVPVDWLAGFPDAVKLEIWRELLRRSGVPLGRLTRGHFQALLALARRKRGSGELHLPGASAVRRRQSVLIIGPQVAVRPAQTRRRCIRLTVPGETVLPGYGGRMEAVILKGGMRELRAFLPRKTRWEEMMDYDALRGSLAVRTWRAGDRFHPLGAPGIRKLQDFMTDAKITREERRRLPIIVARDKPIWLMGWRMDERVKIRPSTRRILRLRFLREQAQL